MRRLRKKNHYLRELSPVCGKEATAVAPLTGLAGHGPGGPPRLPAAQEQPPGALYGVARRRGQRRSNLCNVFRVNNIFSHLFKGPTKHQLLEYSKVHPVMVPKEFGRFRVGSGFTSFLSAGQQEGSVNCLSLQHSFRLKLIIASFIFFNKIVYKTPDFLMKVYFHKISSLRFSKPHLSQPSSRPAPPQPSLRICASCSSQDMAHGTQGTLTPEGEGKVTIS